ncbi:IS200/IS605 family transposase [Chromohalobacter sp. HP20-39]|uniref:IS200/IS605 family transposase n=1 Tax=Chromohalobacter sp. HP20-39 TaxID=3079306 RepID=UPI00294ABFFA|nr:IS200/IS605 family transposase [Chromohalobacter sp. HP20-39]MDV6317967.1 IS200/IS605 family transposase [Chromohalobacter sp. HP20-39]
MGIQQTYRIGRHGVFKLHVHLVFVTKYRGGVFRTPHLEFLVGIFRSVCADFEAELVEFNGEPDHAHLLVTYPPKVALSRLVNSLKGVSSRKLKLMHSELVKPAYLNNALWSPSYFAGSVGGAPISVVRQYIEQQTRPH